MAAFIAPACCLVAWVMRALMAERAEHDPSRHGLASAGVELAAERPSVTTVAQARRKARFVGMGCLHCDLRTLRNSPPPQCDSNHNMCFFLGRAAPHAPPAQGNVWISSSAWSPLLKVADRGSRATALLRT